MSELWGAYLELVLDGGNSRKRMQWVFMPPLPAEIAPDGMRPIPWASYFYRKQERPDHRSIWRHHPLDGSNTVDGVTCLINDSESRGWVAKPLVTYQIHPLEMLDIAGSGWRTPYRILNRAERVTQFMHNYSI